MVLGFYFGLALLIIAGLSVSRRMQGHLVLLILFNLLQWSLTVYECLHLNAGAGFFKTDALAVIMLVVLSILSTTSSYHSVFYLQHYHRLHSTPERAQSIYYAGLCLLIMAQTGAFLASHIAVTWIFVEITTFAATVMIYHERSEESIEAAWKYLFVCSVALTLAFTGILFLGIAAEEAGTVNLFYDSLVTHAPAFNAFWLKLAFLLILIGYSAKMGVFPMHTVTIDAHTVAPPPVSAFISTTLMNVGFVGIYRMYAVMAQTSFFTWAKHVLLIVGMLSVFVAVVYLVRVRHFKRMFAYSSLENMGLVAIGLGVGGLAYYAAILHLIFHSLTKASMFYQIQQVHQMFKSYVIKKTGGYFKNYWPGALVMLLCFICIAGIPPSGMFISEFLLIRAMFAGQMFGMLVIMLLLLTFAVWALGKNFMRLVFAEPDEPIEIQTEKLNPAHSLSQFVLLGLVIYLGLNPPPQMVALINAAIKILP
ncbi:MAG: proton-conducting transporter membrane subunit [bacterium]